MDQQHTEPTKLVIGASGFLGSHVTRRLVEQGHRVRVLLRTTSSTRGIDGLDVERCYGDIFDDAAVAAAMQGCDAVFYCVVDTRAWLRDPTPMYRTNVEGLRQVLDVAVRAELTRFVFTSSIATIGIPETGPATERTAHNWLAAGGDYVRSRVAAEELVLRYSREHGLPAVAMCVANTYGSGDWLPTPHGALVAAAARGRMPFYIKGVAAEVVGIDDAADALILAAERGRAGERYIVSERFMTAQEVFAVAADAAGVAPPRRGIPLPVMRIMGLFSEINARVRGRETRLTRLSIRLMHIMPVLDHGKAVEELGWRPTPAPVAIREAAQFFTTRRRKAE